MYCKHCGSRIEAGSDFCLNCGTPVTQAETQEVQAPTKRNRPKWWFYVVVAVAAAAVIISFVFWARTTGRFNLNGAGSEVSDETGKEHDVTSLEGNYVTSLDEIPEGGMDEMKEQAEDTFSASGENAQSDPMEYLGSYFLCEKPEVENEEVNFIYLVYDIHATQSGESADYYWYFGLTNGMLSEDGTFTIDYSNPITPGDGVEFENLDSLYSELVEPKTEEYNVESSVREPGTSGSTSTDVGNNSTGSETQPVDTASAGSETNTGGTVSSASEKITGISSVKATSQLGDEYGNSYSPYNLFDDDPTTAYAEGASGVGSGVKITIDLDGEYEIDEIVWYPGYQKDEDIFAKNGYPTKLTFSFSDGTSVVSTVDRTLSLGEKETVPVNGEVITDSIQVIIDDAVSGYKYSDTCISDIDIYGRKVS